MTTLREAAQMVLDAIETIPEDIEGYLPEPITDAVISFRAALAQPEPEPKPVAYLYFDENGEATFGAPTGYWPNDAVPLYKKHKNKKWVGLTVDDMRELGLSSIYFDTAKAVAAKLKEKNT